MLLILTSNDDFAADYLISALIERDLPYFRLNSQEISQATFAVSVDALMDRRLIGVATRKLDLADVTCVWYRRAIQPVPPSELEPGERRFVAGELRHLAGGLVLDPSIRWVNPISRTTEAEHKLFQLRVARALGLTLPRTLVSNDVQQLRRFLNENPRGTICKPIYHGLLVEGAEYYAVYTREIEPDVEFDPQQVALCPVLLQERVAKGADVRVTVIGESIFAVEIVGNRNVPLDWRKPDANVRFKECSLPSAVRCQCRQLMKTLGLLYGAIDFVRSPEGRHYFLEVNPAGEWAWLEHQLGIPMRQAFIDLFFEDTA